MYILELQGVYKRYQQHTAVRDVSFSMPEGCIMGLLGPNGAGKTSLIRIINMITVADEGTVYFGRQPLQRQHQAHIGYMPEERGLYKKMKIGEQLLYLAQLKGMTYADAKAAIVHWFKKFDIANWWDKKVEELSKGMQQKVQFIATVMHRPRLLILDEPLSGLDPINSQLINEEILNLQAQGISIIFSTHRMEQVEQMCEHIVLINKGQNILSGKVTDLQNQFKENKYEICFHGALPDDLAAAPFHIVAQQPERIIVQMHEAATSPNESLQYLLQQRVPITSYREILPTFNEIFIKQVANSNAGV